MSADTTVLSPAAFTLNNEQVEFGSTAHGATLLDFLRERGLTGAKEGCAEGECGACAVALVLPRDGGSEFRVVNSCLMLLPMVAGHEIYTVESLASGGELGDAQRAMAAAGGSQCGYCTPGFVVSLFVEQYRTDRGGPCDPLALAGNLCRCTGYRPIRDAAASLGAPPPGVLLDRLARPAPALSEVHTFRFTRPATVDGALAALASDPDAIVVAGASDVAVESNLRGRLAPHLVALEGVPELRAFDENAHSITIGAALPLADLARRWRSAPPAVVEWVELFASPPIRNRATLGGSLVTASPIGDAAPLLLSLDAGLHLAGPSGRRSIPLTAFFTGYRKTALRAGEIVVAIEIPKPLPEVLRFYKVAKRRLDDISTVAAAMSLDFTAQGTIRAARFAFGGMAATPVRLTERETKLLGRAWADSSVELVQQAIEERLTPIGDHRGSAPYRREVAKSLVEKFWWETRKVRA